MVKLAGDQKVYDARKDAILTPTQSHDHSILLTRVARIKAQCLSNAALYGADRSQFMGFHARAEKLDNELLTIRQPHKTSINDRLEAVEKELAALQTEMLEAGRGLAGDRVSVLLGPGHKFFAAAEAVANDLDKEAKKMEHCFHKPSKPEPAKPVIAPTPPPPPKKKSFWESCMCCFPWGNKNGEEPLIQPVADNGGAAPLR